MLSLKEYRENVQNAVLQEMRGFVKHYGVKPTAVVVPMCTVECLRYDSIFMEIPTHMYGMKIIESPTCEDEKDIYCL